MPTGFVWRALMSLALPFALAPLSASGGLQEPEPRMFGFAVGEYRRYERGPSRALPVGDFTEWGLRLARIDGSGAERRATFILDYRTGEYRRRGPSHIELDPNAEPVRITIVDATLVVNAHGFPLEMQSRAASRSIVRRTHVRWLEGSFLVENPDALGLREYYVRLDDLAETPDHDVDGVFAAGLDVWANPGLGAIRAHRLLSGSRDGTDSLEYILLDPGAATRGVTDRAIVGAAARRSRHVRHGRLAVRAREPIEIAGRVFHALRLEYRSGGAMWVDEDARVLRVGEGRRYTRLLLPHEY